MNSRGITGIMLAYAMLASNGFPFTGSTRREKKHIKKPKPKKAGAQGVSANDRREQDRGVGGEASLH